MMIVNDLVYFLSNDRQKVQSHWPNDLLNMLKDAISLLETGI